MPAAAANGGGIARGIPRAPNMRLPPTPPARPQSSVGHAITSAGRAATQAAAAHSPGGDRQSPGPSDAQVNSYKNSSAYKSIVAQVFRAQAPSQQAAIIRGLMHQSNAWKLPELQAIRPQWDHLSLPNQRAIQALIPHDLPKFISPETGTLESVLKGAGQSLGGLIQQLPISRSGGGGFYQAEGAGGLPPGQVAKNFGKDLVNLPAEVGPSIAIPASQALSGHVGKALGTVASPYVNLVEHPGQALEQHPLNSLLLAGGPLHGVTRLLDEGARGLVGKPADLQRPSIKLTGNLTKERPNYSKYPLIRHNQKALEKQTYRPAETGGITPKAEGLRKSQIRAGVSQRVGMNERIRRVEVQLQQQAHAKSFLAPRAVRAAHAAATALKYNPEPALIHGADVAGLITEGVIRRPDTFVADLTRHIGQVSAGRADLFDFPKTALAEHDAYVHALTRIRDAAAKDPKVISRYAKAFQAADRYAKDYAPLQKQAHAFGHYGKKITPEMLDRRTLTPIVLTHMPGARFDPELQTVVRDLPNGKSEVVSTAEMRTFARKETGGRQLAYVSHQRPRGDSAFYVSGQKFPAKAVQRNSMFAFHHGLTDPTHNALLEARVHLQGVVGAHKAMGRLLKLLTVKNKGGYWGSFKEAKADAPPGYQPVFVGPIHGHATEVNPSDAVHASTLEDEALTHSLDLGERLRASDAKGNWALIEKTAVDQLRKHQNQISPNALGRFGRATTGQFRKVALGLSAKHIPGIVQENMIRDIASGVFIQHWFAERNVFKAAEKINPELARERRIEQSGGQVAGATLALSRRQTSRSFSGTPLEAPLRGFEKFMRAPGPRQLSYAWNQWLHLAINGTKRVLEESHQRAAVGKQLMNEFGGLMRLQGEAARQAAEKGYLPERSARRLRAGTERMFGHWTDMTPEAQSALAVSPFGMWWVNSVKWLGRLPIDHPLGTSVLAAANLGTEKQRQALGLDMFAPNALPLYMQGGVPIKGGVAAQNYYSPFGVANDPLETMQSLIAPTVTPAVLASLGDNWLGREMSSPQHPHGGKTNTGVRARVILNSVLDVFIPLYEKAETVAEGGGGSYDTSTLFAPQTKGPNGGVSAGLSKAVRPLREYKTPAAASSSSGGDWGGPSGAGGWGGSSGSGGWG